MIYSCAYPILVNLSTTGITEGDPITYTIYKDNSKVYQGRVFPESSNQNTIQIDISPVCRETLGVFYETIAFDNTITNVKPLPALNNISSIGVFEVRNEGGTSVIDTRTVFYNYNTDYISEYSDIGYLNEPILQDADPRQYLTLTAYNTTGANTFSYQINRNTAINVPGTFVKAFEVFALDLSQLSLSPHDTLTITANGESFVYHITYECRNRFVLYYVNKYGGLDSLLCQGKRVESFSATRTDVRLYDNRLSRKDFQATRINQDIDKSYQLNTGLLDDEGASRIDNLIYSPKVWIQDLDKGTITSCLIDDNNYSVKTFRNDRLITYQINVTESQQYIRK